MGADVSSEHSHEGDRLAVVPWTLLDTAQVPGGGELRLWQRGSEFAIRAGRNQLMNSRAHSSEASLATTACARIVGRIGPRVLIGGLGMGFTLRAALDALPAEAAVIVAELVPAVVAWNRGPLAELSHRALGDPRVEVREGDVASSITAARSAFDAILLDVDNGTDGLTRSANDRLYDRGGLSAAYRALRPGGVVAFWSPGPDKEFGLRLLQAGFAVEEQRARARGAAGGRHVIWLAERTAARKV